MKQTGKRSDGSDSLKMNNSNSDSSLRRRNSMATSMVPSELHIPTKQQSASFPITRSEKSASLPANFELVSLRSSLAYTSLKDLMPLSPSFIQSPTGCITYSGYDLPIKNHLVKQAAWAYLQPMSTSPGSTNCHPFRRIWVKFSRDYVKNPVNACVDFFHRRVIPTITRVFDRFLGAIRVRMNKRR